MSTKVLGVLAGRDLSSAVLRKWCDSADVILAADAGADRVMEVGAMPQVVIGDLDSIARHKELQAFVDRGESKWIRDDDQNLTDCDKLLRYADCEGHAEITLASIEGDRLDHTVSTLLGAAASPLRVRLALRSGIGWILRDHEGVSVPTKPGRTVSLLPLSASREVSLTGVEWPLDQVELAVRAVKSVSNRATAETIHARIGEGSAFLFVEVREDEIPRW